MGALTDLCNKLSYVMFVTERKAKEIGGGRLPRWGYEQLVLHEGNHYWMKRTIDNRKVVWWLRPTAYRLVNGMAILGH